MEGSEGWEVLERKCKAIVKPRVVLERLESLGKGEKTSLDFLKL